MKAIAHTTRDIASLVDIELPKPAPGPRDLLIKVEAVSVNPVDTKRRADPAKDNSPRVLGWDAAGTVAAIGAQVTLFKPGDAVFYAGDVTRPGCNSEFQLVDERIVGRKPKSLDFAQAAAMPLTSITAWESYFDRMKVESGKSLLIINGASAAELPISQPRAFELVINMKTASVLRLKIPQMLRLRAHEVVE